MIEVLVLDIRIVFLAGVDEGLLEVDDDVGVREDAAVREELAQIERDVRLGEKRRQRLHRNVVQRVVGGLADFRIRIVEQVDEDAELLVGARREPALRRQHPDVARDFPAFEELKERARLAHGA